MIVVYTSVSKELTLLCKKILTITLYFTLSEMMVSHFSVGFAGCMKSITLNSMSVNPVDILHSSTSIGVSLGKCDLVDMCAGHIQEEFQCQNSGRCVSEWSDIYCDCHKVFFEGRYCQFGELSIYILVHFLVLKTNKFILITSLVNRKTRCNIHESFSLMIISAYKYIYMCLDIGINRLV